MLREPPAAPRPVPPTSSDHCRSAWNRPARRLRRSPAGPLAVTSSPRGTPARAAHLVGPLPIGTESAGASFTPIARRPASRDFIPPRHLGQGRPPRRTTADRRGIGRRVVYADRPPLAVTSYPRGASASAAHLVGPLPIGAESAGASFTPIARRPMDEGASARAMVASGCLGNRWHGGAVASRCLERIDPVASRCLKNRSNFN